MSELLRRYRAGTALLVLLLCALPFYLDAFWLRIGLFSMAAAVGAPLLSVLGPTKPEQWAPWGPGVTVLRRWPH